MIILTDKIPDLKILNAEYIKIKCLFEAYKSDPKVLFWVQDDNRALISMTDGNMVIYNNDANIEELTRFTQILSPACIFSDYDTLCQTGHKPKERINIVWRKADIEGASKGDTLSSKEIYELLNVSGLSLPEYPYFAVDYCHRLNMGTAKYFAIENTCAAVSFNFKNLAIMNGIASHKKGYGKVALKAILQKNYGSEFLVCCRDSVLGFYEKNGFKHLYYGGYWVKNNE